MKTIKEKISKKIEKSFLELRGWKDWKEYDKVGGHSELDKNIREELIKTSIKLTLAEVRKEGELWEKENTEVLKTEDIVKGKVIIADYVKWDKVRELLNKIGAEDE